MVPHRAVAPTGYQGLPQHPAMQKPQTAPPLPVSTEKKPSFWEKLRSRWPFK
jgi:hypothetical protein